jgi:hypothetical protein
VAHRRGVSQTSGRKLVACRNVKTEPWFRHVFGMTGRNAVVNSGHGRGLPCAPCL